jgi:hypothetical protein
MSGKKYVFKSSGVPVPPERRVPINFGGPSSVAVGREQLAVAAASHMNVGSSSDRPVSLALVRPQGARAHSPTHSTASTHLSQLSVNAAKSRLIDLERQRADLDALIKHTSVVVQTKTDAKTSSMAVQSYISMVERRSFELQALCLTIKAMAYEIEDQELRTSALENADDLLNRMMVGNIKGLEEFDVLINNAKTYIDTLKRPEYFRQEDVGVDLFPQLNEVGERSNLNEERTIVGYLSSTVFGAIEATGSVATEGVSNVWRLLSRVVRTSIRAIQFEPADFDVGNVVISAESVDMTGSTSPLRVANSPSSSMRAVPHVDILLLSAGGLKGNIDDDSGRVVNVDRLLDQVGHDLSRKRGLTLKQLVSRSIKIQRRNLNSSKGARASVKNGSRSHSPPPPYPGDAKGKGGTKKMIYGGRRSRRRRRREM